MERRRIEDNGESHVEIVRDELRAKVIGQEDAIDGIVNALEKARLRDERRPVASFMFLGPTGVGKTEMATSLADIMAVDKLHPSFIKINCGSFASGHEVSALLGAPPSYVGREQDPWLDPEIIEQPGSVVLFDEIEKGHPKLHNLLLQVTEGGEVQLLNSGRVVSFSNSIVIMTSNVGAREMQETLSSKRIGFSHTDKEVNAEKLETVALGALQKQFSPEFINRLDKVITFKSLTDEQLTEVLDTHVERSNHRYRRMGNVALTLSESLKGHLVESSPLRKEYGARPVLRNYERSIESKLSRLVAKQLVGGYHINADYEDEEINFYQGESLTGSSIAELLHYTSEDIAEFERLLEDE